MRRIVLDWYMRQTAEELAETVSRFKTRFGWSHKDIIKLGHVSSKDQGTKTIYLNRDMNKQTKKLNLSMYLQLKPLFSFMS